MTSWLIDTENIPRLWAALLPEIHTGDLLYLFFSNNTASIPIENIDKLQQKGVQYEFVYCEIGKNAVDFQLCVHLGLLLAGADENDSFVIVSSDHGYDAAVQHAQNLGYAVRRLAIINSSKHFDNTKVEVLTEPTENVSTEWLETETLENTTAVLRSGNIPPDLVPIIANKIHILYHAKTENPEKALEKTLKHVLGNKRFTTLWPRIQLCLPMIAGKRS